MNDLNLTAKHVQSIVNKIDQIIREIENTIKSITFKFLKKLSNVSSDSLRGIISFVSAYS